MAAKKKTTSRKKSTRTAKKAAVPKTAEDRAAHFEIQQGLKILGKTIGELQKGLRSAEREIEGEARRRVGALRKEGRAQLDALNAKSKEISASVRKASAAAETSWEELKNNANTLIGEARSAAVTFASRIRDAITR